MSRVALVLGAIAMLVSVPHGALAQQFPDPEFDAKVERPAYTDRHPVVFIDEAHHNFHTAGNRYKPLADLLTNDGFTVEANREKFTPGTLKNCAILVISNAQGEALMQDPRVASAAFEPAECKAVRDWVQEGGALLLIADHHPWGAACDILASKLGIEMGRSMTLDPTNAERGFPAQLNYSRLNGLLGDHPILMGRDGSERIDRVVTFTGQSLKGPAGSVALLKLARSAFDQSRPNRPGRNGPAAGRAQGLAFELGKGRVVALGEAAMLSAQIQGRQGGLHMGMNVPGTDNRQFALNLMHWLSGLKLVSQKEMIAASARAKAGRTGTGTARPAMPAGTTPSAGLSASAGASTRGNVPGVAPAPTAARSLSAAEIAAESEPSIALISGDGSVGTGFLVRPGILATNAHVIDGEFITTLRVRFPSAEKAQQGPLLAELLYEDTHRDLAFLRVKSTLPPLRIVSSYRFRKGEDVTVIGNPGAGEELILENAISRGLMSTRTSIERQRYYQLTIAVNPGNSGGPVFNSAGEVIGVVTRKSAEQESLAFCIPVEDLNLALGKVDSLPEDAIQRQGSRHRLILAIKEVGGVGALFCSSIARRQKQKADPKGSTVQLEDLYAAAIARFETRGSLRLKAEIDQVKQDPLVSEPVRQKVGQLAENLEKLRALAATDKFGAAESTRFSSLQASEGQLLIEVCKAVDLTVPPELFSAFGRAEEKSEKKGASPGK